MTSIKQVIAKLTAHGDLRFGIFGETKEQSGKKKMVRGPSMMSREKCDFGPWTKYPKSLRNSTKLRYRRRRRFKRKRRRYLSWQRPSRKLSSLVKGSL